MINHVSSHRVSEVSLLSLALLCLRHIESAVRIRASSFLWMDWSALERALDALPVPTPRQEQLPTWSAEQSASEFGTTMWGAILIIRESGDIQQRFMVVAGPEDDAQVAVRPRLAKGSALSAAALDPFGGVLHSQLGGARR